MKQRSSAQDERFKAATRDRRAVGVGVPPREERAALPGGLAALAAAPLLQRLIHATGLDYDAHGRSEDGTFFAPEPRAQAYGAYWALLVPVWKSPCSMAWSLHAIDAT